MIILSYLSEKPITNRKLAFLCLLFLAFFSLRAYTCSAQDNMKGPFIRHSNNDFEKYGEGKNIFLNFYQKWMSPIKGGNKCPMHPSCSQYSKIAFESLPKYKAYIKSCERLLRCGKELYLYPTIQIDGITRWYDPLVIKRNP